MSRSLYRCSNPACHASVTDNSTAIVRVALPEIANGRRWWLCPNCQQKLAEVRRGDPLGSIRKLVYGRAGLRRLGEGLPIQAAHRALPWCGRR